MTTQTITTQDRALRPSTTRTERAPAASGAFSAKGDPRLDEMRAGGALGTSMLALYPVFACVIVVLASLSMAGPAVPA